jgi:hypothetical protein
VAAESSAQEAEFDIVQTMEAFNLALGRYTRLVRAMLPAFDGYECKEPEPGKFTLAFKCARSSFTGVRLFHDPVVPGRIRKRPCLAAAPACELISEPSIVFGD